MEGGKDSVASLGVFQVVGLFPLLPLVDRYTANTNIYLLRTVPSVPSHELYPLADS